MWFITKLLDTNANHNPDSQRNRFNKDVIYHEITWYECKSQRDEFGALPALRCDLSRNYLIRMQITTRVLLVLRCYRMWFITKLLDTNANHNRRENHWPQMKDVIYHEITWYECKSQLWLSTFHLGLRCDLSRNYLIRMQITTGVVTNYFLSGMWFITKLLDTNANHNRVRFHVIFTRDVIYHEITWYECKSQHACTNQEYTDRCDLSRNYLIRMQITTKNGCAWLHSLMWFITKLLDTNANHNTLNDLMAFSDDVIYHEITWYECKSQLSQLNRSVETRCDLSRNYLIRMQITTLNWWNSSIWRCDLSRNYLIRMQITTVERCHIGLYGCDLSRNYLIRMQITT